MASKSINSIKEAENKALRSIENAKQDAEKIIEKAKNKEPITIFGDGSQHRPFIYVEDLAEGNVAALQDIAKNKVRVVLIPYELTKNLKKFLNENF